MRNVDKNLVGSRLNKWEEINVLLCNSTCNNRRVTLSKAHEYLLQRKKKTKEERKGKKSERDE